MDASCPHCGRTSYCQYHSRNPACDCAWPDDAHTEACIRADERARARGRSVEDPVLSAVIPGKPRGQGSMTLWTADNGKGRAEYAPPVVAHRNLAVAMLRQANRNRPPLAGPVCVSIHAAMSRPKNHMGSGRNAGQVKPAAPLWPTTYPDVDKIARLVCDALTIAGVIEDDAQIVAVRSAKEWAHPQEGPHTRVELWGLA